MKKITIKRVILNLGNKIDALTWHYNYFLANLIKKIIKLFNKYNAFIMSDKVYSIGRTITRPLHWLWIWKWLDNLKRNYNRTFFQKPGLYIICGEPGAGKSSLAYEIMENDRFRNGKGSYINTEIEKERVDLKVKRYYKYHMNYEITEFFNNKEIVKYPNHFDYNALHVDEAHRIWNYRDNMTNDYKNTFMPFIEYAVGVRHYIGRIFLYTQLNKVDTQLMSLGASNYYTVKKKLGFDYERWLATGKFELTIKGWDIKEYKLDDSGIKKEVDRFFIERSFDIDYFDTFNLRKSIDLEKMAKSNVTKVG